MSIFGRIAEELASRESNRDDPGEDIYPPLVRPDGEHLPSIGPKNKKGSGIPVQELPRIINRCGIQGINCYPSEPTDQCHKDAVFISLNGALRGRGKHLSFERALQEILHHFKKYCPHQTRSFGFITDEWAAKQFDEWRFYIEEIVRSGVSMETYLVAPRMVSRINWP